MATRRLRTNPAGRTSYLLLHWATEIAKNMLDTAYDAENVLSAAFGTANRLLEEKKYRTPGRVNLTQTGKARERELLARMTPVQIEAEYQAVAAQAARANSPSERIQENVSIYFRCGTRVSDNAALDANLVNPAPNVWWLARLFVPQNARNKGYARKLIEQFKKKVHNTGPGWLVVAPGGYDMDDAARVQTYKRLGFKPWNDEMLYLPFNGATGTPPLTADNLFSRNNYSGSSGGGGSGGEDEEALQLLEAYMHEIIQRCQTVPAAQEHQEARARLEDEARQVLAEVNVMLSMPMPTLFTFNPVLVITYTANERDQMMHSAHKSAYAAESLPYLNIVLKTLQTRTPKNSYPRTLPQPANAVELVLHVLIPALVLLIGDGKSAHALMTLPATRSVITGTIDTLRKTHNLAAKAYERYGIGHNQMLLTNALSNVLAGAVTQPGILQHAVALLVDISKEKPFNSPNDQRFFQLLLDTANTALPRLDG